MTVSMIAFNKSWVVILLEKGFLGETFGPTARLALTIAWDQNGSIRQGARPHAGVAAKL